MKWETQRLCDFCTILLFFSLRIPGQLGYQLTSTSTKSHRRDTPVSDTCLIVRSGEVFDVIVQDCGIYSLLVQEILESCTKL